MYEITPQNTVLLVGIDSDGCAFDTMELKHKECFIPNTINYYNLQAVSKYAREAAEFVNLYSKSRGINRFPALIETLQWLQRRPEVRKRGVEIDMPQSLAKWIREETKLGNPALETKVGRRGDPELKQAWPGRWRSTRRLPRSYEGVPPFPYVRESLQKLQGRADIVVGFGHAQRGLTAEWQEHDIGQVRRGHLRPGVGQQEGDSDQRQQVCRNETLMIGDAPGDYRAAAGQPLPVFPDQSRRRRGQLAAVLRRGRRSFPQRRIRRRLSQKLLEAFDKYLPEKPPWPVV